MHRQTPIGGKKSLSQYMLRQVAQGDYKALHTFIGLIDDSTISLDAVDALFAVFHKNPKSIDTSSTESLLMGPTALEGLWNVIVVLQRHPRLNSLMVEIKERVRDNAVRLANWIEVSVHLSHLVNQDRRLLERCLLGISGAIWACLALEGDVVDALTAKPQVIGALLKLWSSHHRGTPSAVVDGADGAGRSTIVLTMHAWVKTESGRQSLLDTFINSPRTLRTFCKATRDRIIHIPEYTCSDGLVRPAFDLQHARETLYRDIMQIIVALGQRPSVFKALCDVECLGCWSRTLGKLVPVLTADEAFEKTKILLMQCLASGGSPLINFQSVVNGGLLNILVPNLARRSLDDLNSKQDFFYYLARLEPYLVYPGMLRSLSKAKEEIKPIPTQKPFHSSALGQFWTLILDKLHKWTDRLEHMDEQASHPVCDNYKLHDLAVKPLSRFCSNCRLVVYCSPECQREDWKKQHRAECSAMRYTYRDRCSQGIRYDQYSRVFHLYSISWAWTESYTALKGGLDAASFTKAILSLDLRFPMRSWSHRFERLNVEEYLRERTRGDCAPLATRVISIIQKHVDNPSPDVWLVEVRLPWCNKRAVVLLIEVSLIDGKILSTQSVVQIQSLSFHEDIAKDYAYVASRG
ncbi:hypothetical protein BKA70DRAFT_1328519 [Coprinopsis sp. MPI-PUGE-AT-0042]|nr:hypothetical protein BKA70DRAFT_1328519 [Coprinopsis sp. MPI-PUGE-AT-0042]